MSNLLEKCCVCSKNNEDLISISKTDSNQIQWSSKLSKCVPEVDWAYDYYICPKCIDHLDVAYTFYKLCLQSYEVRKQQVFAVKIEPEELPELVCFKEDEIQRAINQVNWVSPQLDAEAMEVRTFLNPKIESFCTNDDEPDTCINMDSSDDEFSCPSPEEVGAQSTNTTTLDSLPVKSRRQYERAYGEFYQWVKTNNANPKCISENVLLAYFSELSEIQKSSTLWSKYSMLKSTLMVNENIDIKRFSKLLSFLKRKSRGYKAKKSKVFTRQDIVKFLREAPDEIYLMKKVVLIIGIAGGCRLDELVSLETQNIQDMGSVLLITVKENVSKIQRSFTVINNKDSNYPDLTEFCRKYMNLRPPHTSHQRLFIFYQKGKCSTQVVGRNTFGKIPSQIAAYLKLEDPSDFTGHSFRRTSATMLTPMPF